MGLACSMGSTLEPQTGGGDGWWVVGKREKFKKVWYGHSSELMVGARLKLRESSRELWPDAQPYL